MKQAAGLNPSVVMTPELFAFLTQWVQRHYRDRLIFDDLADAHFLDRNSDGVWTRSPRSWVWELSMIFSAEQGPSEFFQPGDSIEMAVFLERLFK